MPRPPSPDFDRLTHKEAAEYMGCHVRTLHRAIAVGLVKPPTPTLGGPRHVRCDLDEARHELAARTKHWRAKLNARAAGKPKPPRRGKRPAAA